MIACAVFRAMPNCNALLRVWVFYFKKRLPKNESKKILNLTQTRVKTRKKKENKFQDNKLHCSKSRQRFSKDDRWLFKI